MRNELGVGGVGKSKGQKGSAHRLSRLRRFAMNNLGVKMTDDVGANQVYRSQELDLLDQYYCGTQYDALMDWESALKSDEYIPVRDRKPRINYLLGRVIVDRVTSKLTGQATFPKFTIEDNPEDTDFFKVVMKAASFRARLVEPIRKCMIGGSSLARFQLVDGHIVINGVAGKFCYPKFDALGELEEVEIKYVWEDWTDVNNSGEPKCKWFGMKLTKTEDQLYDSPEYKAGVKPEFKIANTNAHNLGWVQAEWLCTRPDLHDPDGEGLFACILDFLDELNYSLSQSSQAVGYGQEPQLTVKGVTEEEIDALVKSTQKAWNLGREGEAQFVETTLEGVKAASEQFDKNRQRMLDVARIAIHDPEKVVGSATSAKAMEVLNEPLVELIDELRTVLEPKLINLILKIALTILMYEAQGFETAIDMPDGYKPQSLDLTAHWPPLFPPTIDDIAKMATAANTAAMASVISRETLTRWLAPVFGVENVDDELAKIDAQPVMNPFGGFDMPPPKGESKDKPPKKE